MAEEKGFFESLIGINLALDQLIVLVIILTTLLVKKSFFKDWVPFLIFWFTYDLMRSFADDDQHVNVRPVYEFELKLFGWLFDDQIPAFWAQNHQHLFFDIVFAIYYSLHMVAPIIIGSLIFYKSRDKDLFKEFTYSFLILSYIALLTFYFYPVAPPWYIWNEGNGFNFAQPEILTRTPASAAGLIEVDRLLGINFFGRLYGRINANPFAALPSLHAGYSTICAYYAIKKYGENRKIWLVTLYPVGVFVAAIYLNHHFIVDLILGVIYVYVSIRSVRAFRSYRRKRSQQKYDEKSRDEGLKDNGKLSAKFDAQGQAITIKPIIENSET